MLTIETKELEISFELKRKVKMICKFASAKPTIINGIIKRIKFGLVGAIKACHIFRISKNK